jgi:hypothetical protein
MPHRNHLGYSRFWLRLYPELRFFESRAELREARQSFSKDLSRRMTGFAVAVGAAMALVAGFGYEWVQSWGLPTWLNLLFFVVLGTIVGTIGSIIFLHRPYIRFVRRYLNEQGIAVCLKCGYDLRARAEPRCSECGTAFDEALLSSKTADDEAAS